MDSNTQKPSQPPPHYLNLGKVIAEVEKEVKTLRGALLQAEINEEIKSGKQKEAIHRIQVELRDIYNKLAVPLMDTNGVKGQINKIFRILDDLSDE